MNLPVCAVFIIIILIETTLLNNIAIVVDSAIPNESVALVNKPVVIALINIMYVIAIKVWEALLVVLKLSFCHVKLKKSLILQDKASVNYFKSYIIIRNKLLLTRRHKA